MAPRSHKRFKQSPTRPGSSNREIEDTALFQRGMLSLPVESLLEILSYFPTISLPHFDGEPYDPSELSVGYVRSDVLCALSQTCRALRNMFLPLRWECLDVYAREGERVWYKQVSKGLESKSKGLARTKELAEFVRTSHIVITRCSAKTVLPAFAHCLSSLPNLHTLEILHAHSQMATALKNAFEGQTFPSIRTIVLPSCAHHILRCCPEVQSVTCTEDDGSTIIGAIAQECRKVEVLEGILPNEARLKRIVKSTPDLYRLKLGPSTSKVKFGNGNRTERMTPDLIRLLAPLSKLSSLEFALLDPSVDPANGRACIDVARELLQQTRRVLQGGPKRLKVQYYNVTPYGEVQLHADDIVVE